MTRLVICFFAAVAFLMAVYWVVPGAEPPAMVAVPRTPAAPSQTVVLLPPPGAPDAGAVVPASFADPVTQSVVAPVPSAPSSPAIASPAPVIARVAARAPAGCSGDAITCMLEGKALSDDAVEATGSIVGRNRRTAQQVHAVKTAEASKPVQASQGAKIAH